MKKIIFLLILIPFINYSQQDFSDNWEDFFSYNNVKDFVKVDNKIYAIVDNAIFVYDLNTQISKKISSVNGLSGETTSALFFDTDFNRIIIGYETGLIEIINENGSIIFADDIERLAITGSKQINHISKNGNKLYFSTPFAIVQYDIENLEFGDTYRIGFNSADVNINQTEVFEDTIYAATDNGIYYADVNDPFLIDFNRWVQPQGEFIAIFNRIITFNNQLFTVRNNLLFRIDTVLNTLELIDGFSGFIYNMDATDDFLTISLNDKAFTLDQNLTQVNIANITIDFDFDLINTIASNGIIYLATSEFGILSKPFEEINYQEIHPEGPLFNDVFSIEVNNNNLWVVYGGYNSSYNFLLKRKGFSHFNGNGWVNTPFDQNVELRGLVDVSIDPFHENRVFISSYGEGILEVVNDDIINKFNVFNSGLELWNAASPNFLPEGTVVSGTVFDEQGDLWVANVRSLNKIKRYDTNNDWTGYNIDEILTGANKGLGEISIDNIGNKWLASRNYGALVFNENGDLKQNLITDPNKGDLPSNTVKAIVSDRNNRIWIGTGKGLMVFSNVGGIFEAETYEANPILIQLEGGTGEEQAQPLLGIEQVNTIAIDGADNKWFGTNSAAVGTNPSGREELFNFNTTNSPLPSNEILKIRVDNSTGKVYFATTKGIVAFNNNVVPFGDTLGETYAYPNPSTSSNEFITIDGRHGTHLPRGTNVKILDSAGYLVHETNVEEGTEIKGGKVIWNKTNLSGRKVSSGIYIVLLTLPDKSETSITKIAIIK